MLDFVKKRYHDDLFVEVDQFCDEVDPYAKHGCFGGGKGGGGGGTTVIQQPSTSQSTSVSEPWAGLQPYLKTAYADAQSAFSNPVQYFPGDTTVGYTQEQQDALNAIAQRAQDGSPVTDAGSNQLQSTLSGDYLTSNPAFSFLGGAAQGGNVGSNIGYNTMGGIASGANVGANPMYGLLNPTAQGQQIGANPANQYLGGMAQGQHVGGNVANQFLGGVAAGGANAANPGQSALQQAAGYGDVGTNIGYNLLSPTAQGGFLNANPYLDKQFDSAANAVTRNYRDAIAPGIDSSAARAGRYGSNAYQDLHTRAQQNLGEQLGDLASNIYGQNYAQERGLMQGAQNQLSGINQSELARQTQAATNLGSLYQGGTGQQIQAGLGLGGLQQGELNQLLQSGSTLGQLYGQDQNRQLQAGQSIGQAYGSDIAQQLQAGGTLSDVQLNELQQQLQAGKSLGDFYGQERENILKSSLVAPSYAQQDYFDLNQLYNVGAADRALQQEQLAGDISRYNFGQLEPRQSIAQYLGLLSGGAGLGGAVSSSGTSTTGVPVYSGSALGGGLGGALGGMGLAGGLGINPLYGAVGGGLLGGLFG